MPLLILFVTFQVFLIVHIIRNHSDRIWITIVLFIPLAGGIAYLIVEVLPQFKSSSTKAQVKVTSKLAPLPDRILSAIDQGENSYRNGEYAAAKSHFSHYLKGDYENHAELLYGIAKCDFKLNNFSQVKLLLDRLMQHNPDYRNAHAHLLYARTLHRLAHSEQAEQEFTALVDYYAGEEARYWYAEFLKDIGDTSKAKEIYQAIVTRSQDASGYYRKSNKKWIELAHTALHH